MERPHHICDVDPNGVTDRETLQLVNDFACVYRSMFQGAVLGPWLENRVQLLIEGWLPGWCLSLAQIVDPQRPDLQSRSWDIVVHKPVPSEMGFPPPSRPYHGYPLLPKALCCAAIDTKSRYNQPRDYARLSAFSANFWALFFDVDKENVLCLSTPSLREPKLDPSPRMLVDFS